MNFGNEITEIIFLSALPEMETNYGNGIAENGREKKKKRIVANKLPKMEGGKEKMLRPQHFSQQITGG